MAPGQGLAAARTAAAGLLARRRLTWVSLQWLLWRVRDVMLLTDAICLGILSED